LVEISHTNIEQFLAFSGRLFEHMLSLAISGRGQRLKPEVQNRIMLEEASTRWADLDNLSDAKSIKTLLEAIAQFCLNEDSKPGFPYKGVNGFALSQRDREKLTDQEYWVDSPFYEKLANTLTICVANNLLEIDPNRKQGSPLDPPKTVFYLNRWICVKFGLSLKFGGWRKVGLDDLGKWQSRGYKIQDSDSILDIPTLYEEKLSI
jgi:hypothetical protein